MYNYGQQNKRDEAEMYQKITQIYITNQTDISLFLVLLLWLTKFFVDF